MNEAIIRFGRRQGSEPVEEDLVSITPEVHLWAEPTQDGVRINLGLGETQIVLPPMNAMQLTEAGNFLLTLAARLARHV